MLLLLFSLFVFIFFVGLFLSLLTYLYIKGILSAFSHLFIHLFIQSVCLFNRLIDVVDVDVSFVVSFSFFVVAVVVVVVVVVVLFVLFHLLVCLLSSLFDHFYILFICSFSLSV